MPNETRLQTYWVAEFKNATDTWDTVKTTTFNSEEEARKAISDHRAAFGADCSMTYRVTHVRIEKTSTVV